jgi:hypothetical protein
METWKIILCVIGGIGLIVAAYYIVKSFIGGIKRVRHLNLQKRGFTQMPAVPFILSETIATVVKLGLRTQENKMAKQGLCNEYQLDGVTRTALTFMYDDDSVDPGKEEREDLVKTLQRSNESAFTSDMILNAHLKQATSPKMSDKSGATFTQLFLEDPKQFAMSWTNFGGVYDSSLPLLESYASILTDANAASEQFWPMIAEHGLAYNLLILKKISATDENDLKSIFGTVWNELETPFQAGELYGIDLRIFSQWTSSQVKDFDRWTPGSYTILRRDPLTKKLTPIAVYVTGKIVTDAKVYTRSTATDSAWIFALMAARTSVTVYGIWLGHVYHWHIVSAPLQMTLFNEVDENHALRKLLDPQSKSLIGFNDTLLLLWSTIGPPTSFSSPELFLQLTNSFATDRNFFDDDPKVTIAKLGLDVNDFTDKTPWDLYPVAADLLEIWAASEKFAGQFVEHTYSSDQAVINDLQLQNWMTQSGLAEEGNVRGLPAMGSRDALKHVLSSIIYRVAAHGNSRQLKSLSPALCFIPNYPPCLQDSRIPGPEETLTLAQILRYMPNTGTIGEMMTFYYIFTYSAPYIPLVPLYGIDQDLYFEPASDPRNAALIEFRSSIEQFIRKYDPEASLIHQWPVSIET